MVGFGVLVGVAIAFVREKTSLASDTVIGVFFAGAVGFGAVLLKGLSRRRDFNPENFLFGDVGTVRAEDLVLLFVLAVVTGAVLVWLYNHLVFTSFNTSLARSRRIPVRLCNYLLIILLGVIVNLCLRTTGALLINAMLIVPAATAANVCRNLRQLFWTTIGLCVLVGIAGQWLSWDVQFTDQDGETIYLGTGGMMVVLSVLLFYVSMAVRPLLSFVRRPRGLQRGPDPVPQKEG
jgi:zinc transport system permease protein